MIFKFKIRRVEEYFNGILHFVKGVIIKLKFYLFFNFSYLWIIIILYNIDLKGFGVVIYIESYCIWY